MQWGRADLSFLEIFSCSLPLREGWNRGDLLWALRLILFEKCQPGTGLSFWLSAGYSRASRHVAENPTVRETQPRLLPGTAAGAFPFAKHTAGAKTRGTVQQEVL